MLLSKKPWSWAKFALKFLIKIPIATNFLAFFCFFLQFFPPGSGSTAQAAFNPIAKLKRSLTIFILLFFLLCVNLVDSTTQGCESGSMPDYGRYTYVFK